MVHLIANHGIVLISHTEIQKTAPRTLWGLGAAGDQEGQVLPTGLAARTIPSRAWGSRGAAVAAPAPGSRYLPGDRDRDGTEVLGWAETEHITCQVFQELKVSVNPN